jgi:threonine dehydrogenase-like Zn-dependent dehydrogenase
MHIEEMPRPEVDGNDIVILKTEGLGICGSNMHWWTGGGSATRLMEFPMVGGGGHEYSGIVAEVGSRVTAVKPGDRVTVDQFESTCCGTCAYCTTGMFSQCLNRRELGQEGFVEYLKLTEKGLYQIPDGIETHAASIVQPYACSVSAVRRAGLDGGETVLVLGGGVLGLCAAGAAKALGAEKVVLTAKYDAQAELAHKFGADVVVRSNEDKIVKRLLDEVGGCGADLVVETVGGHAPTLKQAMEVVRPAGKIAVLGLWDELVPVDSWLAVLKEITFMFFMNHGVVGRKSDYELSLEWMANRKVPAQDLVTHVMPLDEIADAFRLVGDKTSGAVKVILKP